MHFMALSHVHADVHPGGVRLPKGLEQDWHQEGTCAYPQVQDLCEGEKSHLKTL